MKESQYLHYSGYRRARLHDMSQMPTSKWMQIITHSGVLFSVETRHNTQQQDTAKDERRRQKLLLTRITTKSVDESTSKLQPFGALKL